MRLSHAPGCTLLLAGGLLYGAATSVAQTGITPSSSTPGQAIPGTLGVSPIAGSVPAELIPGVMPLSLQEAIDRGLWRPRLNSAGDRLAELGMRKPT